TTLRGAARKRRKRMDIHDIPRPCISLALLRPTGEAENRRPTPGHQEAIAAIAMAEAKVFNTGLSLLDAPTGWATTPAWRQPTVRAWRRHVISGCPSCNFLVKSA